MSSLSGDGACDAVSRDGNSLISLSRLVLVVGEGSVAADLEVVGVVTFTRKGRLDLFLDGNSLISVSQ